MNKRDAQLNIAAAVAWAMVLGAWVIALDHSVSGPDSLMPICYKLYASLRDKNWEDMLNWVWTCEVHPPLPYVYSSLVSMMGGFGLKIVRFSCLLLHGVAIVQVYLLTFATFGRRTAGVIAALLAATIPVVLGWFRLDFQDAMVSVMVLATLQQAIRTDLRRSLPAAMLGIVLGIGSLSKLGYCALMLGPALVFLASRMRGWRGVLNAGLAVAVALAVSGWWYLALMTKIRENFHASTSGAISLYERVQLYTLDSPGNLLLLLLSVGGVLLVCWRRELTRPAVLLVASTWGLGYLTFITIFDVQGRYLLPLHMVGCVLAALPLEALISRVGVRHRTKAWAATVMLLAGLSGYYHLTGTHSQTRDWGGLIIPDQRDLGAFKRAWDQLLARKAGSVLVLLSDDQSMDSAFDLLSMALLENPGKINVMDSIAALENEGSIQPGYALIVAQKGSSNGDPPRRGVGWEREQKSLWTWFKARQWKLLSTFRDEGNLKLSLHRFIRPKDGK